MSFAFVVPPGGDRYDRRTNIREIFKIKKILEISVVPFPAYPQASVEARAAMRSFDSDERRQALIAANKLLMKEF
jgi:phage head maturation protease